MAGTGDRITRKEIPENGYIQIGFCLDKYGQYIHFDRYEYRYNRVPNV
jgi:hypothetical protein